mgnify:CR=1 FL=1
MGAAWNISDENFFNVSWVDMLKLRISNGIGGNISKDSAPYMTAYYFNSSTVGGTYGYVGTRPNPELSWEKTIVAIKFEVPTKKAALASIDKTLAGPGAGDYFSAAQYYFQSNGDIVDQEGHHKEEDGRKSNQGAERP